MGWWDDYQNDARSTELAHRAKRQLRGVRVSPISRTVVFPHRSRGVKACLIAPSPQVARVNDGPPVTYDLVFKGSYRWVGTLRAVASDVIQVESRPSASRLEQPRLGEGPLQFRQYQ